MERSDEIEIVLLAKGRLKMKMEFSEKNIGRSMEEERLAMQLSILQL
jgi:hypothetical protein